MRNLLFLLHVYGCVASEQCCIFVQDRRDLLAQERLGLVYGHAGEGMGVNKFVELGAREPKDRVCEYALEQVVFLAIELDLLRRRVQRAGKRIDLTAKEFALLEMLLRRQGEVLPKSLIASQVWDMNFDSDTNVIEVAIRRLRLKIDDEFPNKLIHTVRGMGYVLEERPA